MIRTAESHFANSISGKFEQSALFSGQTIRSDKKKSLFCFFFLVLVTFAGVIVEVHIVQKHHINLSGATAFQAIS